MKICIIRSSTGVISSSVETIVYQMARHLSKNHDVTLITGRSRSKPLLDRTKNAPFNVVTVPFWPRDTPLNNLASKLYRRLHPWKVESLSFYFNMLLRPSVKKKIIDADVILTWYRTESRLFSNFGYRYGVPCIFNLQFNIKTSGFNKKFFEIDKSVMYIANSKNSKDSLEDVFGIKIDGYITPAVSPEFIYENYPKIPIMEGKKSILFVGELTPLKGAEKLIDVFKSVSNKHDDAILVIVGHGKLKNLLIDKVKKLNLSDKIIFTGQVDYEQMPSYYKSATIFVHPSYSETFGMVVLEAMACGLPVVASDINSLRDITEGTAILLPWGNWNVWTEKIDHLLKNEELQKKMALAGIEKAKEHVWEKKAKELESYIKKAAEFKGKLH